MVLCVSDWKMATSFITLILTLFHYSLPPPSCRLLHSSIIVTLLSPLPGVFPSVGDVGGRRDSWGHNGPHLLPSEAKAQAATGEPVEVTYRALNDDSIPPAIFASFQWPARRLHLLRDLFLLGFSILPPAPWWQGFCSAHVVIHPFPTLAISYFHFTCH